jgi:predicted PurR-regulated permease PerM
MTEHLRRITGRGVMLVIFAIGVLAYSVQTLLMPFIVAGVLAFICTPLVNWIASKAAVWRALAAAVVFAAVVATIGAAGYLAVPRVGGEMLRSSPTLRRSSTLRFPTRSAASRLRYSARR